jgi:hypothetical protein
MQNLREVYALLDAIGWSKTLPPLGVQLDLSEDSWAGHRPDAPTVPSDLRVIVLKVHC